MTGRSELVFRQWFRRNSALRRLFEGDGQCLRLPGDRLNPATRWARWNPDAIERQLAHKEENDVRLEYMDAAEF